MHRSAAGFRAVTPAQHLLGIDPERLGEATPGETTGLLEPGEASDEGRNLKALAVSELPVTPLGKRRRSCPSGRTREDRVGKRAGTVL